MKMHEYKPLGSDPRCEYCGLTEQEGNHSIVVGGGMVKDERSKTWDRIMDRVKNGPPISMPVIMGVDMARDEPPPPVKYIMAINPGGSDYFRELWEEGHKEQGPAVIPIPDGFTFHTLPEPPPGPFMEMTLDRARIGLKLLNLGDDPDAVEAYITYPGIPIVHSVRLDKGNTHYIQAQELFCTALVEYLALHNVAAHFTL
jgi:hypothetical protein